MTDLEIYNLILKHWRFPEDVSFVAWASLIKQFPELAFTGTAYRILILNKGEEYLTKDIEGTSWSNSKKGIRNYFTSFIDERLDLNEDNKVVFLEAEIFGLNLNKLIRQLTEKGLTFTNDVVHYIDEQEIIAFDSNSEIKVSHSFLKDWLS